MKDNFSWSTLNGETPPKSRVWVIGMIIFFGAIATIAFIFDNPLFGIILIIGGLTLIGNGLRRPQPILLEINDDGIKINDELISYSKINSFWISNINQPEILPHLLLIQLKEGVNSSLSFAIDPNIDLIKLRFYLQTKSEEKEVAGPFAYHIIDRLGI